VKYFKEGETYGIPVVAAVSGRSAACGQAALLGQYAFQPMRLSGDRKRTNRQTGIAIV